jgi:hypothetical protein
MQRYLKRAASSYKRYLKAGFCCGIPFISCYHPQFEVRVGARLIAPRGGATFNNTRRLAPPRGAINLAPTRIAFQSIR